MHWKKKLRYPQKEKYIIWINDIYNYFTSICSLIYIFSLFQPITDDDVDRIAMCIRVLAEQSPKMFDIFTNLCRQSLSGMLAAKAEEELEFNKVNEEIGVESS